MADTMMSPADMAAITDGGMNGNMGFFWVFALLLLAGGGFGGLGWGNRGYGPGGNSDYVTQSQLTSQLNQQSIRDGIAGLAADNASMRYDMANLINGQTMAMFQQNSDNQIQLLQAYNNITNGIAALGYQMNTCCCDIKTQMLQDKYEALQEKYLAAQIDISNFNQTQAILGTQGRWVGWATSGSQAAATTAG